MSCHVVGAHKHQRRKRLYWKWITQMSYGRWLKLRGRSG